MIDISTNMYVSQLKPSRKDGTTASDTHGFEKVPILRASPTAKVCRSDESNRSLPCSYHQSPTSCETTLRTRLPTLWKAGAIYRQQLSIVQDRGSSLKNLRTPVTKAALRSQRSCGCVLQAAIECELLETDEACPNFQVGLYEVVCMQSRVFCQWGAIALESDFKSLPQVKKNCLRLVAARASIFGV